MRKLLSFLLCMLLLTGCGAKQAVSAYMDGDVAAVSQVLPEGVSMTLEWPEYSTSAASITYLITNNTDTEITTGQGFDLEVYQDGQWNIVPMKKNYAWTAEGIIIAPGTMRAFSGMLTAYDYRFHSGIYRISKSVGDEICTAEFTMADRGFLTADCPYGFSPLEDWTETEAAVLKIKDGKITENAALAFSFLTKVSLDMNCQLRMAEDPADGTSIVTDVIHEKGRFLRRTLKEGEITENWHSYLVTDGSNLYLSNGADWEHSLAYEGNSLFLLLPEGTADKELISMVEEMTAHRLESNITRYQLWSPDGERSACITDTPTEFSMGGIGYGATLDLQDMDGLETAILDLAWEGETLLLTCETLQGTSLLRASLDKKPLRITVTSE